MAITLEANYSKKLGLPGYSSHQYSVTIRAELGDMKQVEAESARLYTLLQDCVDRAIQETGFLPVNGNGHGSVQPNNSNNGNTHRANGNGNGQSEAWACSDKQKELILKIVEQARLDKQHIETLAQERFGKGVRQLNKMEASGLIDELLEQHPANGGPNRGDRFQKARAA